MRAVRAVQEPWKSLSPQTGMHSWSSRWTPAEYPGSQGPRRQMVQRYNSSFTMLWSMNIQQIHSNKNLRVGTWWVPGNADLRRQFLNHVSTDWPTCNERCEDRDTPGLTLAAVTDASEPSSEWVGCDPVSQTVSRAPGTQLYRMSFKCKTVARAGIIDLRSRAIVMRFFFYLLTPSCSQNYIDLANKLSINKDKTNFVLFHNKNKPIPENFDCIETENMPIKRVQMVQYLGLIVDENLYWNAHVDYKCVYVPG